MGEAKRRKQQDANYGHIKSEADALSKVSVRLTKSKLTGEWLTMTSVNGEAARSISLHKRLEPAQTAAKKIVKVFGEFTPEQWQDPNTLSEALLGLDYEDDDEVWPRVGINESKKSVSERQQDIIYECNQLRQTANDLSAQSKKEWKELSPSKQKIQQFLRKNFWRIYSTHFSQEYPNELSPENLLLYDKNGRKWNCHLTARYLQYYREEAQKFIEIYIKEIKEYGQGRGLISSEENLFIHSPEEHHLKQILQSGIDVNQHLVIIKEVISFLCNKKNYRLCCDVTFPSFLSVLIPASEGKLAASIQISEQRICSDDWPTLAWYAASNVVFAIASIPWSLEMALSGS